MKQAREAKPHPTKSTDSADSTDCRTTPSLINRAAVRRFVMDAAQKAGRADVITHVGSEVFDDLEAALRRRITNMVARHPSGFRTLKP